MSVYPLMLDASGLSALVVGGGAVATRKTRALLDAGAQVHVVAPDICSELEQLASGNELLRLTREGYAPSHLDGASLAIAASNDASVNATVARDAKARGVLVNVADAPDAGNCVTPAVYRSGELVVAVSTGGVPGAAARIRDRLGAVLDAGYDDALRTLAAMRRHLLSEGDREAWTDAARTLIGEDFCARVESGEFASRMAEWG